MTSEKKRNAQVTTEKMNWNARGGTGTHLSEQRRCSSAHIPLAAHVITSTASKMLEPFELASKVDPSANSNA